MKIGYFLSSEEYDPARTPRPGAPRRAGGLPRALDLRPLPPVERRAGPQRLRVVGDRRAGRGDEPPGHDRRHLPDGPHPPGRDRAGRGHQRRAARGPLQPRRRQRRGAQRAHPRRSLARGRRAPGDARGGGRGHPHALAGRPAEPSRPPLHGRERARLRPARGAAADPRLRLRAEGDQARRPDRRRLLHHLARQGRDRPLPLRRRQGPGPRRHQGLLRPRRGRRRARPPTACGPTRRCRASWRRSFRRRRTSSRRASSSLPTSSSRPSGRTSTSTSTSLQAYADAGVDELFVQQIGPEQELFFSEWAPEVLSNLGARCTHEGLDVPRQARRPDRQRPGSRRSSSRPTRSSASPRPACAAPTCTSTRCSARSSARATSSGMSRWASSRPSAPR